MSTKESNSAVRLIRLNQYIRPKLDENKSKNWVLNGKNNDFYQYIIDRYNGSPTNSAILNSYIDIFYGNGLDYRNKANVTDWLKLKTLLNHKELRKLISDYVIFNECAFQVGKNRTKKDLSFINHLPKNKIAPALENDEEEIEGYWYCKDWKKQYDNPPEYISAFGTTKDAIEVYNLKPYKAGKEYFADPDYLAGLPYCEMEEEIANYYVSHIKNGLSFGYIINIPNGDQLTEEQQEEFERQIKKKLVGSNNAGKFILSFNGIDAEITVTPLEINDAHKQWEYLTSESRQQILTAHRVTSPMLFGIKDNTGFGNNAEELDTAEKQLYKRVIQPKQRMFLDALSDILEAYDINLDLYFRPLTEETATDVSLSSHVCCSDEKKKTDLDLFIDLGESQEIDGYELESIEAVKDEDDIELATETGVARSNAKSKYDDDYRIYRYRYAGNPTPEREFCKRMIKANKIYRREDIEAMGTKNVNPGFGMHPTPNAPYSIWKFKGGGLLSAKHVGGTCKHYWEKLTYKRIEEGKMLDVKSPISIDKRKETPASGIAGLTPHSR